MLLRSKKTTWLSALLVLVLATSPYAKEKPDFSWCPLPSAVEMRDATYEQSEGVRGFAEQLVGPGDNYVFIRRVDAPTQLAISNRELSIAVGEKPPTIEEARAMVREDPNIALLANEPIWYAYSSSTDFKNRVEQEGINFARGSVLEMTKPLEEGLLGGSADRRAAEEIESVIRNSDPRLIILEGDRVPELNIETSKRTMILKVSSGGSLEALKSRVNLLRGMNEASNEDVAILNLMPTRAEEATVWGFDRDLAEAYATNGARVASDLERYGFAGDGTTSREKALATIAQAAQGKRYLVLVGESSNDGASVRIPGTNEVLTSKDFENLPEHVTVLGMVCGSANTLAKINALSVVGTIFTNDIRRILRVGLDHRPHATVAEYLDIPVGEHPVVAATARVATRYGAKEVEPAGSRPEGVRMVLYKGTVIGMQAVPAPSSPPPPPPSPVIVWWKLFLAGVVGGSSREVMRWKRLAERKRADKYREPIFIIVSIVELVLGGIVAVFVGRTITSERFMYLVAFVAGAGFEQIVRLGAKLQIWTPAVPHGNAATDRRGSILEYLRA
jgi:hypothetical protein